MNSLRVAKQVFFLAVFTLPFYGLTPTSLGLFEPLTLLSLTILYLGRNDIEFMSIKVVGCLTLLLLGYSLSMMNAQSFWEAFEFPLQFAFIAFIMFPVVNTLVDSHRDIRYFCRAFIPSMLIIGLYGTALYLQQGWPKTAYRYELWFGNPNVFAQHAFLLGGASFALALDHLQRFKRLTKTAALGLTAVALSVIAVYLSVSRSGILASLLFGGGLLITRFGRQKTFLPFFTRSAVTGGLFSILTLVSIRLEIIPPRLLQRIGDAISNPTHLFEDRLRTYRISARAIPDFFPFGTGYNNFDYYQLQYAVTPIEKKFPNLAHNIVFAAGVEGGLLAALGIAGLLVLTVVRSIQYWQAGPQTPDTVSFSVLLLTVSYLIIAQLGTFSIIRTNWLFIAFTLTITTPTALTLRLRQHASDIQPS